MSFEAPILPPPWQICLVGVAGIIVWHIIPRHHAYTRLVVQIVFFAAMTAILLDNNLMSFEPKAPGSPEAKTLLVMSAKLLWWVHLMWALIGFVRIFLVLGRYPREARLLQDIVVGVVYFGGALSILTFVFGIPIGTLVATSGLVAIIVGLALQSTLNDVFSGIALTLGRPYVIGNWITLTDGTEGRVIESTWRATHILTGANNVVVLPNSLLARLGVTNVSRPDETHLLTVTIRVSPTHVPSFVMEVMQTVLLSCRTIIAEPRPIVTLKTLDALALELELQFRVASPAERLHARSEVLDLVYRHCRSVGLLLALPPDSIVAAQPAQKPNRNSRPQPIDLLETISIFTTLTHDEKLSLAAAASIRQFRKGDVIVQQGDLLPALMIIGTGVIVMHRDDKETGRLAPGDFFGEAGLFAGMGEVCTLRALTPVTVHEFDQYAVAPLLAKRPALADELAVGLSERSPQSHSTMPETPRHDHRAHIFRDAIQRLFHVPQ